MFNFLKRNQAESKASIGQAQMLIGKDHSYAMTEMKAYAKEGYACNPTVFSAISLVASSFARVPLRVYNLMDEEQPESDLQKLLDRPNPDEGGDEFRTAAASWMLLTGNCFTEKLVVNGVPKELWNWQPYEMSVGRSKGSRMPSKYIFRKNLEGQREWEVDFLNGKSDILHWRTFNPNPTDSTFGQAPLSAAAYAADSYNAAQKWRYNQAKNGGTLDGILSAKAPGTMDDKQRVIMEQALREKYSGAERAGRKLAVSSSELVFTNISSSLRDAEWLGGTKLNKQEICEVFKVPTQLLGIEGSQTYANFEQALKALYYLAVIPLMDLYCSELNRWLGESFPGLWIGYSKADIDALEPDRMARRQAMSTAGVFSINEIRAEFGALPREEIEADAIMTDPSKIPLGMDVFSGLPNAGGDVAKSLMRAGVPRAEAEAKALEWLYDSQK